MKDVFKTANQFGASNGRFPESTGRMELLENKIDAPIMLIPPYIQNKGYVQNS